MATSEEKATGGKAAGFKVSDRRTFTEEGQPREDAGPPAEKAVPADTGAPAAPRAKDSEAADARQLPPVDFHTFIISLGSSALLHLGEIERPDSGGPVKDLVMAKHTIDILEMLYAKTKGNLTQHEDKLLGSLLYDLRLRYVEAAKG